MLMMHFYVLNDDGSGYGALPNMYNGTELAPCTTVCGAGCPQCDRLTGNGPLYIPFGCQRHFIDIPTRCLSAFAIKEP